MKETAHSHGCEDNPDNIIEIHVSAYEFQLLLLLEASLMELEGMVKRVPEKEGLES
jgi:hypothetical protein